MFDKRLMSDKIKDQIIEYIAKGVFEQDMMLVSVRTYAMSLGINPNTVQKAYQKLEEEGHIISYPKKGSFVKDVLYTKKIYENQLIEKLKLCISDLKITDVKQETVFNLVNQIYKEEI